MVRVEVAASVAASIKALGAGIRLAWQRLAALRRQRRDDEPLARSADRFELERRERDSMRWHSSDASMLGR